MSDATIILGDCLDVLPDIPEASVDAIVTDPPYGLGFMGKRWDHDVPGEVFWREALRVAKPGAHLLAFGGTRKFHRVACAIEDAGWEIRDCLSWMHGQGFPKSANIGKAIDKAAGAKREVVGTKLGRPDYSLAENKADRIRYGQFTDAESECAITAPATEEAKQWEGWGTALKPAWEPIILARKPFKGTVAANVLEHRTGGLNIDGCRIPLLNGETTYVKPHQKQGAKGSGGWKNTSKSTGSMNDDWKKGRWPANVVMDEEAGELLDRKIGNRPGNANVAAGQGKGGCFGGGREGGQTAYFDNGGPSRFFYCPKASKKDRGEGNTHPTVKPTDLMRWLCVLVTPPNGLVLDPFAGSGTTGVACVRAGFQFLGIEVDEDSVATARSRIEVEDAASRVRGGCRR